MMEFMGWAMGVLAMEPSKEQLQSWCPAPYRLEVGNEGQVEFLVWSERRHRWLVAYRVVAKDDPLGGVVDRIRRPKYEILLEQHGCSASELQEALEDYDRRRERTEREQRAKLLQMAYEFATRKGRHVNGPLHVDGDR